MYPLSMLAPQKLAASTIHYLMNSFFEFVDIFSKELQNQPGFPI
jgi:hypothetical protein